MTDLPTLETERLMLRALEEADVGRMTELLNDRDVADNLLDVPHPFTLMEAYARIREAQDKMSSGQEVHFAIISKGEGVMIGAVMLHIHPAHRRAELGYWAGRDYWNKGYMTEAVRRLLQFGFEQLGLNRVFAYAFRRNRGSCRVLEKARLQYEGALRRDAPKNGEFLDVNFYGILRAEYNG